MSIRFSESGARSPNRSQSMPSGFRRSLGRAATTMVVDNEVSKSSLLPHPRVGNAVPSKESAAEGGDSASSLP